MNPNKPAPHIAFPSVDSFVAVTPPPRLTLEAGSVHVWGFSLEACEAVIETFHRSLSDEERTRAARFVRPEHRSNYVLAHGGLRALLARYSGHVLSTLEFHAGATGKPSLLDEQGRPHAVRFNLSHSHGRMLVAVARGQEVGVDLEQVRDKVEVVKLAERFYVEKEYQSVLRCSGTDQAMQFYRYWVAKEAVLKGQGLGITSLQDCEILTGDVNVIQSSVRLSQNANLTPGWSVRWLDCGAGWQGAVSGLGTHWEVRVMNQ